MILTLKNANLTGAPTVAGTALSTYIAALIAATPSSNVIKATVANQAARYALTTASVQNGDYVYQADTAILYEVIDQTALTGAGGYVALATVTAAQISDATSFGRALLTSASVAAQLQLLGGGVAATGSGAVALATSPTLVSPTLVTPTLGAAFATSITLSGPISAPAWTTSGLRLKGISTTLTDTTSAGTVAAAYTDAFGGNTIAASSATTFTNYVTAFFNEPIAGANVTMTNKWALGAASLKVGTSNQLTIATDGVLSAISPVFTTPALGVATGATLALSSASNTVLNVGGTLNDYMEVNVKNLSSGTTASSDLVCTADTGSATTKYIDLGINGSGYTGGVMGAALEGYLYTSDDSLNIGAIATGKVVNFLAGGSNVATNTVLTLASTGATFKSNTITLGTGSLTAPAGAITHAGAFAQTFTATATTTLTLPTTGTLATLAGAEALTNKSINGLTVTSSTGTLTIVNGGSLITAGAFSTTLTATATTAITLPASGTLATLAGVEALTNKSLNGMTVTASTATLTLVNGSSLITAGAFGLTLTATATTNATFPAGTKTLLAQDGSAANLTSIPMANASGVLAAVNGGTANGFFAVSGPATSTKTFTLPNASATILTDNAVVTGAQGGTGVNNSGKTVTLAGNLTTTGAFNTTLSVTGSNTVTFPNASITVARTDAGQTFTGTQAFGALTATSGSLTGLTGLAVRSTGAAFDLTLACAEVFTAGRTLTLSLGDAARTLAIGASASVSGTNTGDQTNISGNAATVTTNANLTGDVTSVGNATTLAKTRVLPGMMIQHAYTQSSTVASTTGAFPIDDTIPQISEGTAYASLDTTITPRLATSNLEVELCIPWYFNTTAAAQQFAIFRDSTVDAVISGVMDGATAGGVAGPAILRVVVPATAASATTFKVRYGTEGGTMYLLSASTATAGRFSTSDTAILSVREISTVTASI